MIDMKANDKHLHIRIEPSEKQILKKAAERLGFHERSFSVWVRATLLKEARRALKD